MLTLGQNSDLRLDELAIGPGATTSRVVLAAGTVRVVASDRYHQPSARFVLETPTSVQIPLTTGFIARYEADRDTTVVLGLYGTTLVRSTIDPQGRHQVTLAPGQTTEVQRGKLPTRPVPIAENRRLDLVESTEILSGGLSPETELEPGLPVPPAPAFVEPGSRTRTPESKVIDQPLDILKNPPGQKPPLPPPLPRPR